MIFFPLTFFCFAFQTPQHRSAVGWRGVGFLLPETCPVWPYTDLNSSWGPRQWKSTWARPDMQENINFHPVLPLMVSLSTPPLRLKYTQEDDEHPQKVSCKGEWGSLLRSTWYGMPVRQDPNSQECPLELMYVLTVPRSSFLPMLKRCCTMFHTMLQL